MKKCVVLTGAGISADSGLKTFRDSDGLWEGHRVQDVATPEAFARNPQLVLDFYNERRRQLLKCMPNAAHLALVELAKYYDVQIVTQNVDDLHERAGSEQVLHLHGSLTKLRSTADEDDVIDWLIDQPIDLVDKNGFAMRPDIVWFGEAVPLIDTAIDWVAQADIVIVIGTSMVVYPAAGLIHEAKASAQRYLVDPNPAEHLIGIDIIAKKAKEGVPELVQKLIQAA